MQRIKILSAVAACVISGIVFNAAIKTRAEQQAAAMKAIENAQAAADNELLQSLRTASVIQDAARTSAAIKELLSSTATPAPAPNSEPAAAKQADKPVDRSTKIATQAQKPKLTQPKPYASKAAENTPSETNPAVSREEIAYAREHNPLTGGQYKNAREVFGINSVLDGAITIGAENKKYKAGDRLPSGEKILEVRKNTATGATNIVTSERTILLSN